MSTLDANVYPHVIDDIFAFASRESLLCLRSACRAFRQLSDAKLMSGLLIVAAWPTKRDRDWDDSDKDASDEDKSDDDASDQGDRDGDDRNAGDRDEGGIYEGAGNEDDTVADDIEPADGKPRMSIFKDGELRHLFRFAHAGECVWIFHRPPFPAGRSRISWSARPSAPSVPACAACSAASSLPSCPPSLRRGR